MIQGKKFQDCKSILTVSSLNRSIKSMIEGEFPLIWVRGEISNFKAHTSGHFYFSLKDQNSQISAVMFRGYNSRLSFKPKDGIEVVIRARVTVYEPRGNYQIVCEEIQRVGEGDLQEAFEKLKNKLKEEGMFSKENKKDLPAWPRHIAVVTSPTGAAIRDMVNVLSRRNKGICLTVIPSLVQGKQASSDIVKGIQLAQRLKDLDVLILARGGGSIEDLWCFNEESVARAISDASVPVISAVGHEIDFTIADFVADLRAPTPSAAAEIVIKSELELEEKLKSLERTLLKSVTFRVIEKRRQWQLLEKSLIDPKKRLEDLSIRCDDLQHRLSVVMENQIKERLYQVSVLREKLISPRYLLERMELRLKNSERRLPVLTRELLEKKTKKIETQKALLNSLSPLRVVERGYSLVTNESGQVIKDVKDVSVGERINLRMACGSATAEVKTIKNNVAT